MREKFKKGEIVSATRTFNGEIITGEFRGYHLFNDEIPDTVVGIVDVPGDGVYDVDVTSLRHCVKSTRYSDDEDEKIRKELVEKISNLACGCFISQEQKQKFIAYLEKQKEQKSMDKIDLKFNIGDTIVNKKNGEKCTISNRCLLHQYYSDTNHCHEIKFDEQDDWELVEQKEQDKCPEYCVRSHCIGCSIYEKEKEKWPIMDVFGFKVGDAVRLKDGDGRKHIIKAFEEIEGVHGPNFYHVEFEDNSARDGIYPGEEYPNGYYTQMEKLEEEPGKDKDFSDCLTELACELYECHDESDTPEDTSIKEYHVLEKWEPILLKKAQQQEWSEEDSDNLERVDNYLWMLDSYVGDDCAMPQGKTDKIRENIQEILSPWVKSLPERFNLQAKQVWGPEKPMDGLEEEMDKFFETMTVLEHENIFEDTFKNIARHFAQWQKSQMMKEAVEGTVHNFSSYKPHPTVLVDAKGFNQGDKVRVIVIPNTDEK